MRFAIPISHPVPFCVFAAHGAVDAALPPSRLLPYALALLPSPPLPPLPSSASTAAFGVASLVHFASDVGVGASVALHLWWMRSVVVAPSPQPFIGQGPALVYLSTPSRSSVIYDAKKEMLSRFTSPEAMKVRKEKAALGSASPPTSQDDNKPLNIGTYTRPNPQLRRRLAT